MRESSGAGMLGWTDTHAHAKIVTRQLQMMSQMVRWFEQTQNCCCCISMSEKGAAEHYDQVGEKG